MESFSRAGLLCLCMLTSLFLGCSNRSLLGSQAAFREGDLATANSQIESYVKSDGEGVDRVIAYLELGSIARANGDFQASNNAFLLADEAIDQIDMEADFSVTDEGVAALTNMNSLPYLGKNYDRIMLSTYRAINYLHLGEPESARVELRKAYQRQVEAVDRNATRIEQAEEEAALAKQEVSDGGRPSYDTDRAIQDDTFQAGLQENYEDLDRYQAYADYVNPYAEFVQGLYFSAMAYDGDDLEWARKAFLRASGMSPDNRYLKRDLAMVEARLAGRPVEPITYVIFETGTAPSRGQIRLDIPLFLVTNEVDYVGANFPRLLEHDAYVRTLEVSSTSSGMVQTQLLSDMDSVVAQEFKNDLPIIITKTLIATGTKGLIAWSLKEATEGQDIWVQLGTRIGSTILQAALNQADLRTWATLPKQVHYARLPTPEDGRLMLNGGGFPATELEVTPGSVNVVMVRSIHPTVPMITNHFVLKR